MAIIKDLKKGTFVKINNEYFSIVDYAHIKMGRGGAVQRVKMKNIKTEAVIENTYNPDENIEIVRLNEKPMQYLYKEGGFYYFMDPTTYEQMPIAENIIKDILKYLKEQMTVLILMDDEEILGVRLQNSCELKIIETEPPLKSARISGGLKPAKLETGAIVQVPLFVEAGEVIKIDTRTDEYLSRVQ